MAHRTTLEAERPSKSAKAAKRAGNDATPSPDRERIFDAFRRWGYLDEGVPDTFPYDWAREDSL